jgi:hypothetical protein
MNLIEEEEFLEFKKRYRIGFLPFNIVLVSVILSIAFSVIESIELKTITFTFPHYTTFILVLLLVSLNNPFHLAKRFSGTDLEEYVHLASNGQLVTKLGLLGIKNGKLYIELMTQEGVDPSMIEYGKSMNIYFDESIKINNRSYLVADIDVVKKMLEKVSEA